MASLLFRKVEGLGNDFMLVDLRALDPEALAAQLEHLSAAASRLCARRRGIGADGLLVVARPCEGAAEAAMIVVNSDGSRPEMCGNGLRCVAAYLAAELGLDAGQTFTVETDAGLLACVVERHPADPTEPTQVRVHMGRARVLGESRPLAAGGRVFLDISTGNPHAIAFVSASEDLRALALEQGPAIEIDPAYQPARTNVEFARIEDPRTIELWVWERGVGLTDACGTGACATAAAAVARGLAPADERLRVRLPGGTLTISVGPGPNPEVEMSGPAREIYSGALDI